MVEFDKKIIGKIIQNFRKDAGIKQSELAEKIGISEKHLSKIETGKNYPSLDNFLRMASILNFNLEDFGIKNANIENGVKKELFNIIQSSSKGENCSFLKMKILLKEILAQS